MKFINNDIYLIKNYRLFFFIHIYNDFDDDDET